jgi:hypothetical protein
MKKEFEEAKTKSVQRTARDIRETAASLLERLAEEDKEWGSEKVALQEAANLVRRIPIFRTKLR